MDLGAVAAALVIAVFGLGGFLFARRYGGGAALESLERANRILERRVHELEESDSRKSMRIAELEAKTDVALAIAPVLHALTHHETQASVRSDRMLAVLDMIAERLGPEPVSL